MATLYEIDKAILSVIENGFQVDMETGEILFDCDDLINLQADREKKIEGCACYVKNLQAEVDALKAEETELATRRKAKEKRIEQMKRYIAASMNIFEMPDFETPKCSLKFRKSTALEITDETRLPSNYVNEIITYKPDKAKIKDALKLGAIVTGCKLVERKNLQVK
jgi:hypothetical protein